MQDREGSSSDPCAEHARKSLSCQAFNPGAKKTPACADIIAAYKKCRQEFIDDLKRKRSGAATEKL